MQTIYRQRADVAINASSVADMAFLLLVFFLVTTTIDLDRGILVKLPPMDDQIVPPVLGRNIFRVSINFADEIMARGVPIQVEHLKDRAKEFIMNPQKIETLAIAPNQAIISVHNDRSTSYCVYVTVYNEIKEAYREIWMEEALLEYGAPFDDLSRGKQQSIKNRIPMVISEAEIVDMKH